MSASGHLAFNRTASACIRHSLRVALGFSERRPKHFVSSMEGAGREQRNSNNLAEDGAILVLSDLNSWRVFGQQDLLQSVRRQPGEPSSLLADRG